MILKTREMAPAGGWWGGGWVGGVGARGGVSALAGAGGSLAGNGLGLRGFPAGSPAAIG